MRILMLPPVSGPSVSGRTWQPLLLAAALLAGLIGCTSYESAYEQGVEDYEPIYCYQSLADAACYRRPYFRDERRLINYYGPSPRRYDRPKPSAS